MSDGVTCCCVALCGIGGALCCLLLCVDIMLYCRYVGVCVDVVCRVTCVGVVCCMVLVWLEFGVM